MYLHHQKFQEFYTQRHRSQSTRDTIAEVLTALNLGRYRGSNFVLEVYYDDFWFIQSATIYDWNKKQPTHEFGGDYNSDFFAVENYVNKDIFDDLVNYFTKQFEDFRNSEPENYEDQITEFMYGDRDI